MFRLLKVITGRPKVEKVEEDRQRPAFRSVRGAYGPEARLVPADATPREAVGIRLRVERCKLGWSQAKFGGIGGVTKGAQTNYERGLRSPDGDYFVAIHAAGADILFILTGQRAPAEKGAA